MLSGILGIAGMGLALVRVAAPHLSWVAPRANTIFGLGILLMAFAGIMAGEYFFPTGPVHLSPPVALVLTGLILGFFGYLDDRKAAKGVKSKLPEHTSVPPAALADLKLLHDDVRWVGRRSADGVVVVSGPYCRFDDSHLSHKNMVGMRKLAEDADETGGFLGIPSSLVCPDCKKEFYLGGPVVPKSVKASRDEARKVLNERLPSLGLGPVSVPPADALSVEAFQQDIKELFDTSVRAVRLKLKNESRLTLDGIKGRIEIVEPADVVERGHDITTVPFGLDPGEVRELFLFRHRTFGNAGAYRIGDAESGSFIRRSGSFLLVLTLTRKNGPAIRRTYRIEARPGSPMRCQETTE